MSDVQSLIDLKKKIDVARAKSERAAGVLDQLLSVLKREWGCLTIVEAQEKLDELTKKSDRLCTMFEKKRKEFEEKWGDELRRIS
jgi:hypothetical protein